MVHTTVFARTSLVVYFSVARAQTACSRSRCRSLAGGIPSTGSGTVHIGSQMSGASGRTLGGVQRKAFVPNVNARRNKKQSTDDPLAKLLHADTAEPVLPTAALLGVACEAKPGVATTTESILAQ